MTSSAVSSRCRRWVTSRQKSRAAPVTRLAASCRSPGPPRAVRAGQLDPDRVGRNRQAVDGVGVAQRADAGGGALGIWGASAGVSNLVGPLLGGLLTVAFGWRADWWALVPLALLAAVAILRYLPNIVHGESARPAAR